MPVVSPLALKYAGATFSRKGETIMAPRKRGTSQMSMCFLDTLIFLEKIVPRITVTNVMTTNMTELRECVKNIAPDKSAVVTRKGPEENLAFWRNI